MRQHMLATLLEWFAALLASAAAFYHNHATHKFRDVADFVIANVEANRSQSVNTIVGFSWNSPRYPTDLLRYECCLTCEPFFRCQ